MNFTSCKFAKLMTPSLSAGGHGAAPGVHQEADQELGPAAGAPLPAV